MIIIMMKEAFAGLVRRNRRVVLFAKVELACNKSNNGQHEHRWTTARRYPTVDVEMGKAHCCYVGVRAVLSWRSGCH